MQPRHIFYLALGGGGGGEQVLQINVDCADDQTMVWFTHCSYGPVGIYEHLLQAICADFAHILAKQHEVIVIPHVLQFEFQLVSNPVPRRDHLLLLSNTSSHTRPQVFPYLLKVKLFTPDHKF